jgi:hypothetical protein
VAARAGRTLWNAAETHKQAQYNLKTFAPSSLSSTSVFVLRMITEAKKRKLEALIKGAISDVDTIGGANEVAEILQVAFEQIAKSRF